MIDAGLDDAREALEGLLESLCGVDVTPQQVKVLHELSRLTERALVE